MRIRIPKLSIPGYRYSLDPGISGTGVAIWKDSEWKDRAALPVLTENLYPSARCTDWTERAETIGRKLLELFNRYPPLFVYCEFPEFQDSAKGYAVATKGDLQKLTFIVGFFAAMAWEKRAAFVPYKVSVWKGQLPKPVVISRIIERIPGISEMKVSSHSFDAIGVGLYAKGIRLSD